MAVCGLGDAAHHLAGGNAECYPIDSDLGHMAGILETFRFDHKVRDFLSRL